MSRGQIIAWLRALRPHFFALPAGAALAGSALGPAAPADVPRVALAALACGIGWGSGQLVNDLFDVEADAVDAPDRPAVRGQLPRTSTLIVAGVLGLAVTAVTLTLHPGAPWLVAAAAPLLLGYGLCKPWPVAGNLAHGALIAVATLIGAAAVMRELPLSEIARRATNAALVCGAWSALYLEANYEKDRRGDRAAGYRTLPHVIGLRASAAVRVALAAVLLVVSVRLDLPEPSVGRPLLAVATSLVVVSALGVLRSGDEASALRLYRCAVHGASVGMLALGSRALGAPASLAAAVVAVALTERAFSRSENP